MHLYKQSSPKKRNKGKGLGKGFNLKTLALRPLKSEAKFSLHLISGSSLLTPEDSCAQLYRLCTAQVGSAEQMMGAEMQPSHCSPSQDPMGLCAHEGNCFFCFVLFFCNSFKSDECHSGLPSPLKTPEEASSSFWFTYQGSSL